MQMTKPGKRTLAIADYDVLPAFVLRLLLRTADMTVEEFQSLL